jgi:hypothetical protein
LLFNQANSILAKLLKLKGASSGACTTQEPTVTGNDLLGCERHIEEAEPPGTITLRMVSWSMGLEEASKFLRFVPETGEDSGIQLKGDNISN